MRKSIFVLILVVLLLTSCSQKPAPTPTILPTPTVSDLFKTQAIKFIEEATKLKSMTAQGVNFADYSTQLAEVNGVYELLKSLWPENFEVVTKDGIEKALEGWYLSRDLWSLKIGDYDNPVEPNTNHFEELMDYGGDYLLTDIHPDDYIVKDYRGKTFLPFDKNISILFSIANDYFELAQPKILKIIQ